jgi:hypothetical protein
MWFDGLREMDRRSPLAEGHDMPIQADDLAPARRLAKLGLISVAEGAWDSVGDDERRQRGCRELHRAPPALVRAL